MSKENGSIIEACMRVEELVENTKRSGLGYSRFYIGDGNSPLKSLIKRSMSDKEDDYDEGVTLTLRELNDAVESGNFVRESEFVKGGSKGIGVRDAFIDLIEETMNLALETLDLQDNGDTSGIELDRCLGAIIKTADVLEIVNPVVIDNGDGIWM